MDVLEYQNGSKLAEYDLLFNLKKIFGSENVGDSLFSGSNSAWNLNYFEEIRANAHFQDFALILSLAAI